jgi:hypothetical protein
MTAEHERWLTQAVEFARTKRYDEAREYALRVVREDGRNAKALWIVATSTNSMTERRNALKALIRVQPDNLHAQKMLDTLDRELKASGIKVVTGEVRSVPAPSAANHTLLYAVVAVTALVIMAAVVIAAGIL